MRRSGVPASVPLRSDDRAIAAGSGAHDSGGIRQSVSGDRRRPLRPGVAWLDGVVRASGSADGSAGSLSGGRQRASGARRADGGAVGPTSGGERDDGPGFDRPVDPGGYAWWYVDALSDDGRHALTIIAFIGSVFSPYYAWSGRRDPLDHCAVNVALYGPNGKRWAMTERRRAAVTRDADALRIGPSAVAWDGSRLTVEIDERCAPLPRRVRGRVVLEPEAWNERSFPLSARNNHVWRPIAPFARVRVKFSEPDVAWSGAAYLDFNQGDAPLERDFRRWTWSRARLADGAAIFYEAERRDQPPLEMSLRFGRDGAVREASAPPKAQLPTTLWRVQRETRSEADAKVTATFEDSPFYARSAVAHRLDGEDAISMHESLDLDRFSNGVVRAMLPFRMPRW